MKALTTLLTAAVLLAPLTLSAADFEGTVTMNMTGPGEHNLPMTFSIKPGFTRVDMTAPGGQTMATIINAAKQETTMLFPERKMYMTHPMPEAGAPPAENAGANETAKVEKTGEHEKILGYDATKYVATSSEGTTELWITDELGMFTGFGNRPMGGRRFGGGGGGNGPGAAARQAWEDAFKGKQAFPLRVVTTSKDGKQTFKMEATAIDRKSLPDSVFQVPSDYQDMGSMMRGLGRMGMPGGLRPPHGANGN